MTWLTSKIRFMIHRISRDQVPTSGDCFWPGSNLRWLFLDSWSSFRFIPIEVKTIGFIVNSLKAFQWNNGESEKLYLYPYCLNFIKKLRKRIYWFLEEIFINFILFHERQQFRKIWWYPRTTFMNVSDIYLWEAEELKTVLKSCWCFPVFQNTNL